MRHYIVLILKCLNLYNYCCAAVFWKLRRAEFPLGLARVDDSTYGNSLEIAIKGKIVLESRLKILNIRH